MRYDSCGQAVGVECDGCGEVGNEAGRTLLPAVGPPRYEPGFECVDGERWLCPACAEVERSLCPVCCEGEATDGGRPCAGCLLGEDGDTHAGGCDCLACDMAAMPAA